MVVLIETHNEGEAIEYRNATHIKEGKYSLTIYGPNETVLAILQLSDIKKLITDEK